MKRFIENGEDYEIRQIIPAAGFYVLRKNENGEKSLSPVVCFALCFCKSVQCNIVIPMEDFDCIDFSDADNGHYQVVHKSQIPENVFQDLIEAGVADMLYEIMITNKKNAMPKKNGFPRIPLPSG